MVCKGRSGHRQVELGIRGRRAALRANSFLSFQPSELHSFILPSEGMLKLCWLPLSLIVFCCLPVVLSSSSSDIQVLKRHAVRRTNGGVYIPLLRRSTSKMRRRDGQTGTIGLGDFQDVLVIDCTCLTFEIFTDCPSSTEHTAFS